MLDQDYAIPNINETQTRVRPKQTRFNFASAWLTPTAGIERWATNVSVSDYAHDELTLPITEGLFEKDSIEINSKIEHSTIFGWRGTLGINVSQKKIKLCHDHTGCDKIPNYSNQQWNGNQGNLFTTQDDYEFVHDTPMPITESSNIGYFLVEHKAWEIEGIGQGIIELGARIDIKKIEADPTSINPSSRRVKEYYDDKNFLPTTFSASSTWFLNDSQRLSLSLSRAQRAPDGEELYWNGDHHATFSYQLDNAYLTEETAYTTDLIWNITGENHLIRSAVYYYHFNDYIYNDLKNITDPYHNHPVYKHEQEDARFYGFEFSWQQQLTHALSGTFSLDSVRAHLLEGDDKGVPRLPPATASIKINWKNNNWSASAENHWVAKQNIIAQGERSTAGFNTFDIAADYTFYFSQKEIVTRLKINNLFNVASTNHVSYLKEFAPNPGRNIQLQSQLYF